jgi:titin
MRVSLWLTFIRRSIGFSRSPSRRQVRSKHFRLLVETLEGRWVPSTFLVTNTDDGGAGSLRQAILDANATPGTNEINFATGDGGAQTIRPTTALPEVTHSIVIDGTTQQGFTGSPLIGLDGTDVTPGASGLVIRADGSTVKGLVIANFRIDNPDDPDRSTPGLVIAGDGNVVQGNYLGTDPLSTEATSNGIGLWLAGSSNLVGGTTASARNVISANWYGVYITGSSNLVEGNFVGTDSTGAVRLGNVFGLSVGGSNNLIGGTTAEARDLISGNLFGLGVGGVANRVQGNFIGTDLTGTRALANDGGVGVGGPNLIGGTEPGAGNLISGNTGTGVTVSTGATVQGNYIGTDVTGTQALGNRIGVAFEGSSMSTTLVGGTEAGAGNLISGNSLYGLISSTSGRNVIQGNYIGTDVTGTQAVGNGSHGVFFETTFLSQIGGTEPGAGNLISGNGGSGIFMSSSGGDNLVQGNRIGTDVSGTQPLGNARDGVHVDSVNHPDGNTIGGEDTGAGNTIAFNGNDGVLVDRSTHFAILGNSIFANGNLGIELVRGGNHDQAAPVLTSATTDGTSTTVTGTLTSTPNTTFTLELFANRPGEPSSGEQFLGTVVVTTDAEGNASFTVTFAIAIDPGWLLTATATDPNNNTSPFSAGVEVTG